MGTVWTPSLTPQLTAPLLANTFLLASSKHTEELQGQKSTPCGQHPCRGINSFVSSSFPSLAGQVPAGTCSLAARAGLWKWWASSWLGRTWSREHKRLNFCTLFLQNFYSTGLLKLWARVYRAGRAYYTMKTHQGEENRLIWSKHTVLFLGRTLAQQAQASKRTSCDFFFFFRLALLQVHRQQAFHNLRYFLKENAQAVPKDP